MLRAREEVRTTGAGHLSARRIEETHTAGEWVWSYGGLVCLDLGQQILDSVFAWICHFEESLDLKIIYSFQKPVALEMVHISAVQIVNASYIQGCESSALKLICCCF